MVKWVSVSNFSFLACLVVDEKFVLGWGGWMEHVATMSSLNPSYIELLWVELSWVELSWVRVGFWQLNDLFMTCSRFVHSLFIKCLLLVQNLFTTCSLIVYDLSITCSWLFYDLFILFNTCSWQIATCSQYVNDLFTLPPRIEVVTIITWAMQITYSI